MEEAAPRKPTIGFLNGIASAAKRSRRRRRLRALLVQGAAVAPTDVETRQRMRSEIKTHLELWVEEWDLYRDELGIDPDVDMRAMVVYQ